MIEEKGGHFDSPLGYLLGKEKMHMRGVLPRDRLEEIDKLFPRLPCIDWIRSIQPDVLPFHPERNIEEAIVCLHDAADYVNEALFALRECKAGIIWYRELQEPPSEQAAIFEGRFFADNVSLRLYSAAEHLANFLKGYLKITNEELKRYRKKSISEAAKVGRFLEVKMPTHKVTALVQALMSKPEWEFAMQYRNNWVHQQRPLIADYGVLWKRKSRWRKTQYGYAKGVGILGDEPEITLDDLVLKMSVAYQEFANLLQEVFEYFVAEEGIKIEETEQGLHISF